MGTGETSDAGVPVEEQRMPDRAQPFDTTSASMSGSLAPQQPSSQRFRRRAGFWQFLLVSHSFTGLIFARPDDAPPIQLAGCCGGCCICLCCGKARALTVRHRLFIFLFTLVATFFITLFTTLGLRSSWWAVGITVLLLVPLTCWLKGSLPGLSERLNGWQPRSWKPLAPRVEELALFVWLVAAVAVAAAHASVNQIIDVARNFAVGLAIANAVEVLILVCLYCPCKWCCCGICMPEEYDQPWRPYDASERRPDAHNQPTPSV